MTLYLQEFPAGTLSLGPLLDDPAPGVLSVEVLDDAIPFGPRPVPTLEATHILDDRITLHDFRDLGPELRWRLRCRSISLGSMADANLPSDPRTGGTGTIGRRGTRGGRVVTYAGAIQAVSADALRRGSDELKAACWDVDDARPVRIDVEDASWVFRGRPHADVVDNTSLSLNAVPTPYQAEFTVSIVLNDPRVYGEQVLADLAVVNTTPPVAPASLPWPRLPVVLRPPLPAAGTGMVSILGKVPTGPTLRIHGPRSAITITDLGRDVRLVLDVDIPADTWIDVDLRGPAVTSSDGDDVTEIVRWPDSTWWQARNLDVKPGVLQLAIDSETVGPGANVDVLHQPAYA